VLLIKGNTLHTAFVKYSCLFHRFSVKLCQKALVLTGESKAEETARHILSLVNTFIITVAQGSS